MIRYADGGFYVRDAAPTDIPLYAQLLRNDAWLFNSGFKKDEYLEDDQILKFLTKEHPNDIKWVCFHGEKGFVSFVHFNVISNDCAVAIGGMVPRYLNSGLGIKYYAWCIDLYFKMGLQEKVRSNVYQENLRSCKMNIGLGFELVGLKCFGNLKFDVYETDRNHFYNSPIAMRILRQQSK